MKIIDLLNKLANGEEVPKKIKITILDDRITEKYCFCYDEENQEYRDDELFQLGARLILERVLNEKVEIIEEDKKIEKLDVALLSQCDNWLRCPTNQVTKQDVELNPYIIDNIRENTLYFQRKINELIDEINNLKEK